MQILRRFFLVLAILIFINSLLLVTFFWTINNTVARREVVKDWISSSGVYEAVVSKVIEETQSKFSEGSATQIVQSNEQEIDPEILSRAASSAFSPVVLQESAETVLDGVYNWLEGKSPNLVFALDLTEEKQTLVDNLVAEAEKYVAELPECTPQDVPSDVSVDPFSTTCRPPGGVDEQLANFKQEFMNSEEFFPDPVLGSSDLKIRTDSGERTLESVASSAPDRFQQAKNTVWATIFVALLSAIAVVLLSLRKRSGVLYLSIATLVACVLVGAIGLLVGSVSSLIKLEDGSQQESIVLPIISLQETIIMPIIRQITSGIAPWYYTFCMIYLGFALVGFTFYFVVKSRDQKPPM